MEEATRFNSFLPNPTFLRLRGRQGPGHSLGGALATLFVADVGEFGVDAGRGLPPGPLFFFPSRTDVRQCVF